MGGLIRSSQIGASHSAIREVPRAKPARFLVLFSVLLVASISPSYELEKGVVVIESATTPRPQKEALLILPGFGSRTEGVKDIRDYFAHKGYDLYIPDYIRRESIDECVASLDRFIREQKLGEYGKLHIVSYIIGAWTLNRWIRQHPENNVVSIVYDRSPLQERAAFAMVRDRPLLTRLVAGRIVEEFSKTPYEPIPNDGKNIGIIMESRATRLIRNHRKTVLSLGGVKWDVSDRMQDHDDYFYTLNEHDEMYHQFSETGKEILYFVREGKFTPDSRRTVPNIDPFGEGKPPKDPVSIPESHGSVQEDNRSRTARRCHVNTT